MNQYKLSICIPTYNFGDFIGETLTSITTQLTPDVEIVVVDGGSTDSTSEIVNHFLDGHSNIKYHLLEKRGGIDRDMATSVELASGDYCWIFSADDMMIPGAIPHMLSELKTNCDLYLCRHNNATVDMRMLGVHPVLNNDSDRIFSVYSDDDRYEYFSLAITTEAFFSFMGGIIIKRSKWISLPISENFVGSCWAHVARIFELMKTGITIKYISCPWLIKRGDNDSFRENGLVERYKLAIDGYYRLVNQYFGAGSFEAKEVGRVLGNEFTIKHFLYARLMCFDNPSLENKSTLDDLFGRLYFNDSFLNTLRILLYKYMPIWGCRIGLNLYLKFMKFRKIK